MEQQMAFDTLNKTFTSVPILACFNVDQDVIVEMDASDYADYVSTSILSQYNNNY
jgi:hypothetical protein